MLFRSFIVHFSIIPRRRSSLAPRYRVARDHGLPAFCDIHLLVNVLHSDVLVSARSLALKREQALLTGYPLAYAFVGSSPTSPTTLKSKEKD